MILSPDKEIARLMRFAIKLGIKNDEAWDLAADAYLSGLEHGCVDWHFTSICLKHSVLQYKRDRKRRNLDYQWTFREGEDEAEELRLLSCYPTQIAHVTAMSALRAIEALPEGYARVLRLAAQEYTADEIAAETGILKSEVYWRLREGRKTLRKKGFQEEKAFRGDSQFTGIKRDCRKWQASIRKGKAYVYLGHFDTATEAALAYDLAAKRMHGKKAKLNFSTEPPALRPEVVEDVRARLARAAA